MTRPVAAALLALCLVLAGCGSTTSGTPTSTPTSPPSATPTPSSTPTPAPTSTPVPLDPASVPGASADGVNVTRLADAHEDRLNRTSYRLNVSVRRGPTRLGVAVETAAGPVPTYVRTVRPNRTRAEYYDDRYYVRLDEEGNVSYRVLPYFGRPDFNGGSLLREYMSLARYEPTETVRVDGTRTLVLAAGPDDLRPGAFSDATVEEFTSSARVDADGVVRRFRFVATGTTADGRPFVVRVGFAVTDVGDTVVRTPSWLSAARDAAANRTATPGRVASPA